MTSSGEQEQTEGQNVGDRSGFIADANIRPIALLKANRVSLVALVLTAGMFWWLCGWTGDGSNRAPLAVAILLGDGIWALAWLASAAGLGWIVARWLVPEGRGGVALEMALGVGTLFVAEAALGRFGLLAGRVGAWALLIPGLVLCVLRLLRTRGPEKDLPALLLSATPPLAVLLVAACSAPGALWATEFGGYDALSYHLELPRAWAADGRIVGLEHNVYSFLPSYMEGAYLHLFALRGGAIDAVYSCQLLHVGITLLAAAVVRRIATIAAGPTAGNIAAVLTVGTPWIVVVGSLAYNEMAVVLLGGGALLIVLDAEARPDRIRTGLAVGLLIGAACGAKLTAVGFVAIPMLVLLALAAPNVRRAVPVATLAVAASAIALGPYLVGNLVQTGNPVFPFATGLFGSAHWTDEQAETWNRGHAADLGPVGRVQEGMRQLARDESRDVPAPAGVRGRPGQWSVLPWLAVVGVAIACLAPEHRRIGVRLAVLLLLQTLFWLAFTHIKARFMVPVIVPATIAIGIAVVATTHGLVAPVTRQLVNALIAILLTIYALLPVTTFGSERSGAPAAFVGAIEWMNGAFNAARFDRPDVTEAERQEVRATAWPTWWINHALPAGSRVLSVGESMPLYYARERFDYQTTWDRGPLSTAMRQSDDAAAWIADLRDAGYTHVLVNPTMLMIWEQEGWNDPLITADRVFAALDAHARPIKRWDYGMVLYVLRG